MPYMRFFGLQCLSFHRMVVDFVAQGYTKVGLCAEARLIAYAHNKRVAMHSVNMQNTH